MQKVRWSDLTLEQQMNFDCSCGFKKYFAIPQFIFKASCCQHDLYYRRGGDIFDKAFADVMFYAYMLEDIVDLDRSFFVKAFYFKMATLYFLAVTLFGCFAFTWGRYRTIDEILQNGKIKLVLP